MLFFTLCVFSLSLSFSLFVVVVVVAVVVNNEEGEHMIKPICFHAGVCPCERE